MRMFNLSFVCGIILTSTAYAVPDQNWPYPIPAEFHTLNHVGNPLRPMEDTTTGHFFLLDQARINRWAANYAENGAIRLRNQNVADGFPNQAYDDVDYIITSDLIFGSGQNVANVNLEIDQGVEIWFALRTTDHQLVAGNEHPALDLDYIQDHGDVSSVCTITINTAQGAERRFQCFANGQGTTIFKPWRDLNQFLPDNGNYPRELPAVILNDANADVWPLTPGVYFAGGIVINSPQNVNEVFNSINNVEFWNLIGSPAHGRQDGGKKWANWNRGVNPPAEINLSNLSCFGIMFGSVGSGATFSNVLIRYPMFNGIVVSAPSTTLSLSNSEVRNAWILGPEGGGLNGTFIMPFGTDGATNGGYGVGDGLLIDYDALVGQQVGATVTWTDGGVTLSSLSGIEILGPRAVFSGTNVDISNNGLHNATLRPPAGTWPHSAGISIQCAGIPDPQDHPTVSIFGSSTLNSNQSNGIAIYPPNPFNDQDPVGVVVNGEAGTAELNGNLWKQSFNEQWWQLNDSDVGAGILIASNGNFVIVNHAQINTNCNHGILLEDAIVDGNDDNNGDDHRNQGWRNHVTVLNSTINQNGANGHGFSTWYQDGIWIRGAQVSQDGNDVSILHTTMDGNYATGIHAFTFADVTIDGVNGLGSNIMNHSGPGVFTESSHVSVIVDNSSEIHANSLGVYARGSAGSFLSGVTVQVDHSSAIDENTDAGVMFEYVKGTTVNEITDTYVHLANNSSLDWNGSNIAASAPRCGFYGYKTHNTDVVLDQSHANSNYSSGVYFAAEVNPDTLNGKAGDTLDVTNGCIDDQVLLQNDSQINDNQGLRLDWPSQGGVVMLGLGHRLKVDNSTLSGNTATGIRASYGAFLYVNDRSKVQIVNGSEVSSNKTSGIYSMHAELIELNSSTVSNNGWYGILNYRAAGNPPPNPPRRWIPMVHPYTLFVEAVNNPEPLGVFGNGVDGITVSGTRVEFDPNNLPNKGDYLMYVRLDNTSIRQHNRYGFSIAWFVWGYMNILNNCVFANNHTEAFGRGVSFANCYYSSLLVQNSTISANATGINFGEDETGAQFPNTLDCTIEGCLITGNKTGVFVDPYPLFRLKVQPGRDASGTITYPMQFINNSQKMTAGVDPYPLFNSSILVHSAPSAIDRENPDYRVTLLVDAAVFSDTTDMTDADRWPAQNLTERHIKLMGAVKGFPAMGSFEPQPFATIRKCTFTGADNSITLIDWCNDLDPVPDDEPYLHVRNNLFKRNNHAISVQYDEDASDNQDATPSQLRIFNNTVVGYTFGVDPVVSGGMGISLSQRQGRQDPAIVDTSIYNNLFQTLDVGIWDASQSGVSFPCQAFQNVTTNANFADEASWQNIASNFANMTSTDRLYANSPCINRGYARQDEDQIVYFADSTVITDPATEQQVTLINFPDIGHNGGGWSAGVLDRTHYNVLSGTNGGQMTLAANFTFPGDEYEGISTGTNVLSIPAGVLASFEANSIFYVHTNKKMSFSGGINADWNLPADLHGINTQPIYFARYPGNARWGGFSTTGNNVASTFNGCVIDSAVYGIYAITGLVNLPPITVSNSSLRHAYNANLNCVGDFRFTCVRDTFSNGYNDGVYLASNEALSSFSECVSKHNGHESADAGMLFAGSWPTFKQNIIALNYSKGLYLSGGGMNIDGIQDQSACLIYNNGDPGIVQSGPTGAEIYLVASAQPIVTHTNIWDTRQNIRTAMFVYKMDGDFNVDFTHNFWGDLQGNPTHGGCCEMDDQGEAGFDQQPRSTFFYSNLGQVIYGEGTDSWEDDCLVGVDWVAWQHHLNEVNDFETALALQDSRRDGEAVEYFVRYILNDPSDDLKLNALNRLASSWRMADYSLDSLHGFLRTYATERDDAPEISWVARKLAAMAAFRGGLMEQALNELAELRESAPNLPDSVALEMDRAFVEYAMGGDGLDMVCDYQVKVDNLRSLMDAAENQPMARPISLPTEFLLAPAFPNPFNGTTTISYALPRSARIHLGVYDLSGRLVTTLVEGSQEAGNYHATWQAESASSGFYFVRLHAETVIQTQSLVLIK